MTTDQLKTLAQSIASDFLTSLKGAATLSPDEQQIVARCSETLAEAAAYAPGADADTQETLRIKAALAYATLGNLGVAHAIDAEAAMRAAVYNAIIKGLGVVLGAAVAAI